MTFSELENFVLLNRLSIGGGREVLSQLLAGKQPSEAVERILAEDFDGKREALTELLRHFSPEREIEQCLVRGIRLITLFDAEYPAALKEISDPPIVLYQKGSLEESDQAAAAIVGSRLPSIYGLTQAKRFASGLAEKGLTIISGMAPGIDQAAHEGALMIPYGRTAAVLGCGLDVDYPPRRGKLSEKIIERGVILSEYALSTPPRAENFPRRNRIISGMSLGVLVIEARERSGSLITAHEAAEQGREVFAVPGPVDCLTSRGCHQLLKEGAALIESPEEVLEALSGILGPLIYRPAVHKEPVPKEIPVVSKEDQTVLDLLSQSPLQKDEIAGRLGLAPAAVLRRLTKLELLGRIRQKNGGIFACSEAS